MRRFEKISKAQFLKDISNGNYDNIMLPYRKTKNSAGYDFFSITEITLRPGEIKKIPSGIKVIMNEDEFLGIFVRSSMGFKYNVRMCNQVGIIDYDYYNNIDNEGHIWICLQNHGKKDYTIKVGDAFAQGIFMKYYKTDDDNSMNIRKGGLGSTNKE